MGDFIAVRAAAPEQPLSAQAVKSGQAQSEPPLGEEVIAIFSRLDADKNHRVTADEFSKLQMKDGTAIFERSDINHNHYLVFDEFDAIAETPDLLSAEFQLLDTNHNGSIDVQEFMAGSDERSGETLRRRFHFLDEDHDHGLSKAEYLKHGFGVELDGTAAFRQRDADNNGTMSLDEFLFGRKEELQVKQATVAFQLADTDKSGGLSLSEFLASPIGRPDSKSRYDFLDSNHDGTIDRQEYVADAKYRNKLIQERFFDLYDKDKDAHLSLEEFRLTPVVRWMGPVLEIADGNGDGKLNLREFLGQCQGTLRDFAVQHFAELDEDRDGFLRVDEFPVPPNPATAGRTGCYDAEDAFARLDANYDQALTLDEFSNRQVADDPGAVKRFDRWKGLAPMIFSTLDHDANGKLSLEEFVPQDTEYNWVVADGELLRPAFGTFFDTKQFRWLDQHADGKLRLEEFLAPKKTPEDIERATEAFKKVDFDQDSLVSFEEFKHMPFATLPLDPLAAEMSFKRLDLNQDHWLTLGEFQERDVADDPGAPGRLETWRKNSWRLFASLDHDHSGRLSLQEFRPYISDDNWVTADGEILRALPGMFFDERGYRSLDGDHNQRLTLDEYLKPRPQPLHSQAKADFSAADLDGNGYLTFEEYKRTPYGIYYPDRNFKSLDKDRDGHLTPSELPSDLVTQKIAVAFDADHDGVLSLEEFLATPLANPIGRGQGMVRDENNDGRISLEEFVCGDTGAAQQLWTVHFRQFDSDNDGFLTWEEYPYPVNHNSYPTQPIFAYLDNDHDKRLSFSELFPKPDQQTETFRKQFAAVDRNGDGFWSWEEYHLNDPGVANAPGRSVPGNNSIIGGAPVVWVRPEDRPTLPDGQSVFAERDADHDQRLSFEEYSGKTNSQKGLAIARHQFVHFDRNSDEHLTWEEFRPSPLANPDTEGLFIGRDRDGNNALSVKEFMDYRDEGIDRLKKIFERFDADKNGTLSKVEFEATPDANPRSDVLLATRDVNGDGRLNINEFAEIADSPLQREMSQFDYLDIDRDGRLTLAELKLNDPAPPKKPSQTVQSRTILSSPATWSRGVIVSLIALAVALLFLFFKVGQWAGGRS
jgi:Ca2+-binding EF-hand superfamily protein